MKTFLTIALVMSMSFTAFASPEKNQLMAFTGVSYAYQQAKVTLLEGAGKVKVSILDSKGTSVYHTQIDVTEDVVLPFNLSAMPKGHYVIRLESNGRRMDHTIEVKPKK